MRLIPAALLCFTQAALAADSLVVLDVERSCRDAAALEDATTTLQKCLQDEHSARAELAAKWATFERRDRQRCVDETTLGGDPSYVEVLACINMARDARKPEEDVSGRAPR